MYPPITSLQQLEQFAFAAFGLFVNREQGSILKTASLLRELDLSKIPSSGRAQCTEVEYLVTNKWDLTC